MKRIFLLLVVIIAVSTVSGQTVTGVSISFKTTNNDKDDDTGVETVFKTSGDVVIAYARSNYGRFPDHTESIEKLDLRNENITEGDIPGSTVTITIFPNGHDTWNFDFDILVDYDNGERKAFPFTGIHLSQNNTIFVGTVPN